ncbi:MAG: nitroreductase family protein [Bacteroidota bacterium]
MPPIPFQQASAPLPSKCHHMSFLDLARSRRSVRQYQPTPIPDDLLQQVLEAGRWAPSAVNSQPWEFIVITDPQVKQAVYDLAGVLGLKWKQLLSAPVVIVICARKLTGYSRDDCIFAAENMLLCAADLGLGTCWVGGFSEDKLKRLLSIPQGYILPGMLTIGYPASEPSAPARRELAAMVHHDTFENRGLDLSHVRRIGHLISKLLRLQRSKPPS